MGWRERVGQFLGQSAEVSAMAQAGTVRRMVPPETQYVTVGSVLVLHDALRFVGGPVGRRPYGRDLGWLPEIDGERQEIGLLALTGPRLAFFGPDGLRWDREVMQLADIDGHRKSGFVVVARDGGGLAVGPQTPVETPRDCRWRTVAGVSNLVSGWDRELQARGVQVLW